MHSQIAALGDQYTSFCNVNSSINCDKVLGSPWSKVGSIPVAWLALASYMGLALLFGAASRKGQDGRKLLALGTAGVIGSLVFSAYMAAVSTLVLGTICLLCTTLYAVALGLAVLCWLAAQSYAAANPQAPAVLPRSQALGALLAAVAVTGLIAIASAPETPHDLSASGTSLEELEAGDPSFYSWYISQPRISNRALRLADDERSDQPVTLIEYSDFDCGHCRRNAELLSGFASRRADLLHIVHRHFPLDAKCNGALPTSLHTNACRAAEAAECAAEQELHSAMSKLLFDNQGKLFESNLFDLADQAGVDAAQFRACMENHDQLDAVVADARSGEALDLSSTPTLFLNGRRIVGTFENVAAYERAVLIEAALAAP